MPNPSPNPSPVDAINGMMELADLIDEQATQLLALLAAQIAKEGAKLPNGMANPLSLTKVKVADTLTNIKSARNSLINRKEAVLKELDVLVKMGVRMDVALHLMATGLISVHPEKINQALKALKG